MANDKKVEVPPPLEPIGSSRVFQDKVSPIGEATGAEPPSQGRTREWIALWLVGLLCTIVALTFVALFLIDRLHTDPKDAFQNLKGVLDVLVGPIVTLLSSVVGFYFGSRTAQSAAAMGAGKTSGTADAGGSGGTSGAADSRGSGGASVT